MKPNKFKHAIYDWLASKDNGFEFTTEDLLIHIEDAIYSTAKNYIHAIIDEGSVINTGRTVPCSRVGPPLKLWQIVNIEQIRKSSEAYYNHDFNLVEARAKLRRMIREKIKNEYQKSGFKAREFYSIADQLGLARKDVSAILQYDMQHGKGIKIAYTERIFNGMKSHVYVVMQNDDFARLNKPFEDTKINILTPKIPDLDSIIFGMGR